MISQERLDELYFFWNAETEDYSTQKWRENLTFEERGIVFSWEKHFSETISRILSLSEKD